MHLISLTLAAQSIAVEEATGWAKFLQDYGGWGVSIVFLGGIIKLWMDNKGLQERIFGLLDKQNQIMGAMSELAKLISARKEDK